MLLIKKIEFFTEKRMKHIKKYIHEINQVQLIKKQLGGTEETIIELFRNLDSETNKLGLSITKATQQIEEAYQIIEELKKQNKTCNESLLKKTEEIQKVREEILDKHSFLEKLLQEHEEELFEAKIQQFGKLDYYKKLPEEIKKELRSYTETDLPIFFMKTENIQPTEIEELKNIIISIKLRKILIPKVLPDVIRAYDSLIEKNPLLIPRLNKLTDEALESSINGAFNERTRVIDEAQLNKTLIDLYKV